MGLEMRRADVVWGLIPDSVVWSKLTLNDPRVMTRVRVKVAQKSSKVDPP